MYIRNLKPRIKIVFLGVQNHQLNLRVQEENSQWLLRSQKNILNVNIKDFSGYKYCFFEKSRNLGKLIFKKNDEPFEN